MKLDSKQRYNNRTTLWAVVPAVVFCGLSSFVFWMSPLGLGFNSNAVEKLNSGYIHELFQLTYWAGPLSILIAIMLIIGGVMKPTSKVAIKRIILILTGTVVISQISMLIYLSS